MASSSSMNMISLFFFIFMIALFQTDHASADSKRFVQQVLDGHNSVRRTVGVPALEYDHHLARVARDYADERRHDCKLVHSPGHKYGENLFWGQRDSWTVKDAMTNWAAEKKYYSYKHNTCTDKQMCGHYTQMIWKTTTRVGCAHIICDSGDTYIVCNYSPPGNYRGVKPY